MGSPFMEKEAMGNLETKAGIRRLSSTFLVSLLPTAVYNWGLDFCYSLDDALDTSNSMQTLQKTTTRRIVDGKVVSETNDTKGLRR